ncbi:MAG TPA: hypothetical protein VFO83_08630 [Aggregicoccus sp.]|nr:hypothetical protein [Aggregicoccus sp.]
MMGWLGGVVMVAALGATPVADGAAASRAAPAAAQVEQVAPQLAQGDELAAAMSYPSSVCKKKRVDACGCHHVYGTRHCHPDRKGKHCEAVVKAQQPWLQSEPLALKL